MRRRLVGLRRLLLAGGLLFLNPLHSSAQSTGATVWSSSGGAARIGRLLEAPVEGPLTRAVGRAVATSPLEIEVAPARQTMSITDLAFRITLRNVSDAPLLLNGGAVLGNGRHAWAAIGCTVQAVEGRRVPVGLHWRLGPVGGRMYVLGVVLGPGDTHTIAVTPEDMHSTAALPVGQGALQCRFTGRPSDQAEWPATWTGNALSVPVGITLTAAE